MRRSVMKIELCEDNGRFNNGVVSLVILQITQNDGSVVRVPYQADKTIQELYADVGKITLKEGPVLSGNKNNVFSSELLNQIDREPHLKIVGKEHVIQNEDIVKCVKLHPRDPGSDCDLVVGNEYRVIGSIRKGGTLLFYEVLDDNSGTKIRIPTFPDEIELVSKFIPPPPRKQVFEITKKCPKCGEVNSLELNGNQYSGECTKCGVLLTQERKVNV